MEELCRLLFVCYFLSDSSTAVARYAGFELLGLLLHWDMRQTNGSFLSYVPSIRLALANSRS